MKQMSACGVVASAIPQPVTVKKWPELPGGDCRALGRRYEWPKTCEERGSCAYGVSASRRETTKPQQPPMP